MLLADEAARATSGGSVMVRDPLETSWRSAGTDRFDNEIEKAVGSVSKGESRAPSTAISVSPGELSTTPPVRPAPRRERGAGDRGIGVSRQLRRRTIRRPPSARRGGPQRSLLLGLVGY